MLKFLIKNLRYPASARSIGQEGTVYVRFVVNNTGQVVDVEVVRGVSAVLDQEAMRVVALMKKWKPGMQHDIPVNVRMVIRLNFNWSSKKLFFQQPLHQWSATHAGNEGHHDKGRQKLVR